MSKYKYPIKIAGHEVETPVIEDKKSILKGSVLESSAAQKVNTDIIITDPVTNAVITTIRTNEDGNYSVTLKGDKEYIVIVNKEGFKPFNEKILLPTETDKEYSLMKLILLEKLPEEKK